MAFRRTLARSSAGTGADCRRVAAVVAVVASSPLAGDAQILRREVDTLALPVDSSDVLARARREQAGFERHRVRLLPATWGGGGVDCQEVVGRFCFWFDDGGRAPPAEPPAVEELRDDFLAYLDSVQALLPGEGWITGQRVWYRGEAGRWDEALRAAGGCGAEPWWCAALRGLALHRLGRTPEADAAFEVALSSMEPERASRWKDTRWLVRRDARRALEEARGTLGEVAEERLWALADPLLLAPGNDRRTEHYARWTVATLQSDARSPFGIRWGRDMEELLVRMGWEISWERVRDSGPVPSVIGHHHPDGQDFFPEGDALRGPAAAVHDDLAPRSGRPRTMYAPVPAQQIVPLEGQVAVFPRAGDLVVVATHFLPPDTAPDAERDALRARMAPPANDTLPRQAGLFLLPEAGGPVLSTKVAGEEEGVLILRAPAGRYVAGVESWAPALSRAARFRTGLSRDTVPPDVATLSDLLLLRGGGEEAGGVEAAARRTLVRPAAPVGEPLAVAWEVHGLGWAPVEVRYELAVERTEVGVFRRLGRALGLVAPERPLVLSWTEPGPSRPGPALRVVGLDLGSAEPGTYQVTLRASLPGRGALVARAPLTLESPRIDDEARPS